jgi:hypothetical protein
VLRAALPQIGVVATVTPIPLKPLAAKGGVMFLVRDIMYCKPGKVRPMVEKFTAMRKMSEQKGLGTFKVMTDVTAERFWTVVCETEVKSMTEYEDSMKKSMEMKELQDIMQGYHDLVESGRREIYKLEGQG